MQEMQFWGYPRPDGTVGIRNHVLILPASVCASDTTSQISRLVEGTVTFHNQNGCSQVNADKQLTMDVMAGYAANPNIYGTVLVSLGCEGCQLDQVADAIAARTNKPLRKIIIQEAGGTLKTVELGVRYARELVAEAGLVRREAFPLSRLILGTECGGSDPTSGLAANPVIGSLSDRLAAMGGTSILSETPELIGAEPILARRGRTPEIGQQVLDMIRRYEKSFLAVGEDVRMGNPSPGNKAGGITTLEEKSLGCVYKGGTAPIEAVYDYAKPVTSRGLVVMDTPGNDPSSIAGMVAGGAQIVVFSSGRGTPTGHPIAPVIKLTGNRITFEKMRDNIDFSAAPLIYGEADMQTLTDGLLQLLVDTANGKPTKAEALGFTETAIARFCNYT